MRHNNQITLRGLDPRIQRELRAIARREGISLNKAAHRLLAKGAGLNERAGADHIGNSLDPWIGTWTPEEADDVLRSIESCEQIDRELWD